MSDNLYFEPPSRLQLVDKLAHLLRFSNTLLVLAGPSGAGVTTVTEQLHSQAVEDDVYILSLNLAASTNLNNLLKLLNDAMDELVNPQDPVDQDGLSLLHKKIETLSKLQRKLLISIDNADFLSDEASESLVNLLSANQGKIAVTLAGNESLVTRTRGLVEAQGITESLHVEILSPFNRLETEEFIQLRFLRGNDFSSKQLSEIYLNSEGYPGRITLMTSQMIKSGKITLNGKNSILPVPHIIGIAVLLTAITAGLMWQSNSEEVLEEALVDEQAESLAGTTSQALVLDIEQESIVPSNTQAQQLENEIAELSERIKAQEQLIEQAKEDSASVNVDDLQTAGTSDNSNQELDQQDTAIRNTDIELIDQIDDSISVAVTPQESLESLQETIEQPLIDDVLSEEKREQAKTALMIETKEEKLAESSKATIETAKNANDVIAETNNQTVSDSIQSEPEKAVPIAQQLALLTNTLKKNIDPKMLQVPVESETTINAVVIEDLRDDKQPKKAREVSVVEEVVVTAEKPKVTVEALEPMTKKVIAKSKPPVQPKLVSKAIDASAQKWLSHEAILSWPATGYTLQLLGARSQSSAIRFLQDMPNSQKMYYYKTMLKNKDWNVIIYGQYANRAAATAAIAKLPKALRELKPWPKAIKSVKNSLRK